MGFWASRDEVSPQGRAKKGDENHEEGGDKHRSRDGGDVLRHPRP
jgi:hypothetical protein